MMTIPLVLVESFKSGVLTIKREMDKLKKSIDPFGMYFMVKVTTLLPAIIAKLLANDQANKLSLVFTNVPGPKTPLVFTGKKCTKLVFFAPALGSLSGALCIVSHCDVIKIGCISDESQITHPNEVINLINKNFEEILADIQQ